MILLSRIIKSEWIGQARSAAQTIKIKPLSAEKTDESGEALTVIPDLTHLKQMERQAKQEAADIIQEAQRRAKAIAADMEQKRIHWEETEKKKLEEEAREIGYMDGMEMGRQRGYEEASEQLALARQTVEAARHDAKEYVESSDQVILELAMTVAEKILMSRIEESHDMFMPLVKQAVKEARDAKEVQLRIHPVQYEMVLKHKEELQHLFSGETSFYILPDEELQETGCAIEYAGGRVEAGIDSQLQEMKRKLEDLLEGE